MALKTMLQHHYLSFFLLILKKEETHDVVKVLKHKDGIQFVFANANKRCCFSVLASLMMDYKE